MARMLPIPRSMTLAAEAPVEFYNMMDDFFTGGRGRLSTSDMFRVDIQEDEGGYIVEADLPGVKKENLDIEMNEERLIIEVKAEEVQEATEKNYVHRERRFSSMARGAFLKGADSDGITAKLENGVLTVHVPKKVPETNVRKITLD